MINEPLNRMRWLPPVHEAVAQLKQRSCPELAHYDTQAVTWAVRTALEQARTAIQAGHDTTYAFAGCLLEEEFKAALDQWLEVRVPQLLKGAHTGLRRVINATGVILHTNCGRALLESRVADFVAEQAKAYSNLELDIDSGQRGSRYQHVEELLVELTGAEAAFVVNNNAAAVLLIMNTLANQKEVIVSRGELVEVGGSFRIPEVLKSGGAQLVEVGATNKTWLHDYEKAVSPNTAFFLKVHTSNYRIEGFHHAVSVAELVQLGLGLNIPVIEDLGSGSFLDGSEYGLPKEPTIQDAVKTGAALVTFSGDKLLGGPQAGIIVGQKPYIDKLKANQLSRALRVDKLTLAALMETLRIYRRGEVNKLPVWHMIAKTQAELRNEAERLCTGARQNPDLEAKTAESVSYVGGGAFPTAKLAAVVCALRSRSRSAAELEKFLRMGDTPILARIEKDEVIIDPRTLLPEDYEEIRTRLQSWNNAVV